MSLLVLIKNISFPWYEMDAEIFILFGKMVIFNNHKYMVLYIFYLVWCWLTRIALSVICEWN